MKLFGWIIAVVAIMFIVLVSSAFVVSERDQCFITQFGRPVGDRITEPGIHFKIPFIQKAHFFDRRFLEWDGHPNQLPTKDKRYISIDTYARWKIVDPLVFFQKVTDERGAQTRLDDILDGATRNAVANHDLVDIVRSKKREDQGIPVTEEGEQIRPLQQFQGGRHAITRVILQNARPQLAEWGIELLDIQFKRLNYESDVQQKIFERMISERKRIADKYRSEGEGEAAKIAGEREKELKTIQSQAYRKVQEIQGEADAEATRIYAGAYNQSPAARDFYGFLKTLETYDKSLSDKDWLLLSTDGEFYRYLKNIGLTDEEKANTSPEAVGE